VCEPFMKYNSFSRLSAVSMISINRENERLYYVVRQGVEMAEKAGSYKVGNVYFTGICSEATHQYFKDANRAEDGPLNVAFGANSYR
jgi:hypothetical protein